MNVHTHAHTHIVCRTNYVWNHTLSTLLFIKNDLPVLLNERVNAKNAGARTERHSRYKKRGTKVRVLMIISLLNSIGILITQCTGRTHFNAITRCVEKFYQVQATGGSSARLSLPYLWMPLINQARHTWFLPFLNPFMPNGISHPYQLEHSISVLRNVGWYFSFLFKF